MIFDISSPQSLPITPKICSTLSMLTGIFFSLIVTPAILAIDVLFTRQRNAQMESSRCCITTILSRLLMNHHTFKKSLAFYAVSISYVCSLTLCFLDKLGLHIIHFNLTKMHVQYATCKQRVRRDLPYL